MKLYCATTNPGKVREFQTAYPSIELLPDLKSIPPPVEDGTTFEQNATLKAVYYSRFVDGMVFADDSGLEVDALGGAPGVHSARFAGTAATDADNNRLLLEKLRGVDDRAARYVCVIAVARAGAVVATARATVEGRIIDEAKGSHGFGYDPYFFYPPFGKTFGETLPDDKWAVSHRGKALEALLLRLKP